jgi:hypothetical protein
VSYRVKKVLLILLSSLSLVRCSSMQASGDRYNLDYVHEGMTRDEVVEIMRQPKSCVHFGEEEVMVWNGGSVSLLGGKVVDKTALEGAKATRLESLIDSKDPKAEALVDECFKNPTRNPTSESEGY